MTIKICYSLVEFMNASPVGYQYHAILGPVPWLVATKAGTPGMYTNIFQVTWTRVKESREKVHRLPWSQGRILVSL